MPKTISSSSDYGLCKEPKRGSFVKANVHNLKYKKIYLFKMQQLPNYVIKLQNVGILKYKILIILLKF